MARHSVVSNSTTLQQVAELPGLDLDVYARTSTIKEVVNMRFTKISKNKHEIQENFGPGGDVSGVPPRSIRQWVVFVFAVKKSWLKNLAKRKCS